MNILLLSYDYPPNKGGIANVSFQIANQLNRMNENIIFVAQKTKGDREFDRNNRFPTYRCIDIFLLRELLLIILLSYLVLRYKIGIIYLFMWCQGGMAAFLTSRILNIPYILHAHGEEFIDYKKTPFDTIKYGLFRRQFKKTIFKNAKKTIAVSNYTKDILIKLGIKEDKIEVIYNGVDINKFKPGLETDKIRSEHNLYNKKVLFTVSRLKKYKGHDIVISLMPQLLERIPNLVYLIGGSGQDRQYLESLVRKLHLQNNVIFTGLIDESSLPLYYNACDLYIMLTREKIDTGEFEGFGLVFLEANSCEKPVIGAKTGGIPDAIVDGKTGYLVDPDNTQEVIQKIIPLLENKELAENLGREGRNRIIREGFTWESIARRILAILTNS